MKRTVLVIITAFSLQVTIYAQEATAGVAKSYFRSDPFTTAFSSFLKHIINDPALSNKNIRQRTDSTFFSISGIYTSFNPFFFKPQKVAVILTETEVQLGDSIPAIDTIFLYQVQAITNADKEGLQDIKKEFEKIHRNIRRGFYKNNYDFASDGQEKNGEIYHYFEALYAVAPVSLAWEIRGNDAILSITIRMKMKNNRAVLPASLYALQ